VFSGVQAVPYWSSTAVATVPGDAQVVILDRGLTFGGSKASATFVWPVRGGR
jgi:hypothetical protein